MEIMKAPARQPKTAPAQVRGGEAIEGVVGRHAEFSDDPIFPHLWLIAPPVGPHETSGRSLREGWSPKEKWQITKIFGEVFPSRGPLSIWRGVHVDSSRRPGEAVSTNKDQERWKPERAPVPVAICLLHFLFLRPL